MVLPVLNNSDFHRNNWQDPWKERILSVFWFEEVMNKVKVKGRWTLFTLFYLGESLAFVEIISVPTGSVLSTRPVAA